MSRMSGYAANIEVSAGSAGPEWMMKAEAASSFEGARSIPHVGQHGTVRPALLSNPWLRGKTADIGLFFPGRHRFVNRLSKK